MSQQHVCDECAQPIDTTKPYYNLVGNKLQMVGDVLTTLQSAVSLDYHEEHVPGYKIQGEPVTPGPGVPIDPGGEDQPAGGEEEPPPDEETPVEEPPPDEETPVEEPPEGTPIEPGGGDEEPAA